MAQAFEEQTFPFQYRIVFITILIGQNFHFHFFLLRKPICASCGNNYPTCSLKNLLEQSPGKVKSQAGLAFQEGGQLVYTQMPCSPANLQGLFLA